MFLFFSSDIYNLYRKDIISTLSLPESYAKHFRYPTDILPSSITKNLGKLVGKEGVIVYVKGNDFNTQLKDRIVEFLPIRMVRIKTTYFDVSTGLYHFFLELGKFIKSDSLPMQTAPDRDMTIPPYTFLKESLRWSSEICQWHEKIQELIAFDSYFKDHLFFKVDIRYSEPSSQFQVPIYFDDAEQSSYFVLREDKQYLLDIALYNSSEQHQKFEDHSVLIEYETDDLFVTNPDKIIVGANADNRNYKIVTKDIKSVKTDAYLKFQSVFNNEGVDKIKYDEIVRLSIKRNISKMYVFILISTIGFLGTILGAYTTAQLSRPEIDKGTLLFLLAISLSMFIGSALGQFYFFNKRS